MLWKAHCKRPSKEPCLEKIDRYISLCTKESRWHHRISVFGMPITIISASVFPQNYMEIVELVWKNVFMLQLRREIHSNILKNINKRTGTTHGSQESLYIIENVTSMWALRSCKNIKQASGNTVIVKKTSKYLSRFRNVHLWKSSRVIYYE